MTALAELDALCKARGFRVGLRTRVFYTAAGEKSTLESVEVYDRLHDEGGLVARLAMLQDVETTAEKLTELLVTQGVL